jgi:hypothetical protein
VTSTRQRLAIRVPEFSSTSPRGNSGRCGNVTILDEAQAAPVEYVKRIDKFIAKPVCIWRSFANVGAGHLLCLGIVSSIR